MEKYQGLTPPGVSGVNPQTTGDFTLTHTVQYSTVPVPIPIAFSPGTISPLYVSTYVQYRSNLKIAEFVFQKREGIRLWFPEIVARNQ